MSTPNEGSELQRNVRSEWINARTARLTLRLSESVAAKNTMKQVLRNARIALRAAIKRRDAASQ